MQAHEVMKHPRKAVLWLVVAVCLALSFVGFFYAYYYSWLLSTPGVAEDARQHYDSLSRAIGIPSLMLFAAAVVAGVWVLFRKR
jgi:hypothetical protein